MDCNPGWMDGWMEDNGHKMFYDKKKGPDRSLVPKFDTFALSDIVKLKPVA